MKVHREEQSEQAGTESGCSWSIPMGFLRDGSLSQGLLETDVCSITECSLSRKTFGSSLKKKTLQRLSKAKVNLLNPDAVHTLLRTILNFQSWFELLEIVAKPSSDSWALFTSFFFPNQTLPFNAQLNTSACVLFICMNLNVVLSRWEKAAFVLSSIYSLYCLTFWCRIVSELLLLSITLIQFALGVLDVKYDLGHPLT